MVAQLAPRLPARAQSRPLRRARDWPALQPTEGAVQDQLIDELAETRQVFRPLAMASELLGRQPVRTIGAWSRSPSPPMRMLDGVRLPAAAAGVPQLQQAFDDRVHQGVEPSLLSLTRLAISFWADARSSG